MKEKLKTACKRLKKMWTASKIKQEQKCVNTCLTLKIWRKSWKQAEKRVLKMNTASKIKLEQKCVNTCFTSKKWKTVEKPWLYRLGSEPFRNWTVWEFVAVLIFCKFLIVFNFENMKEKLYTRKETCSKDENSV